VGINIGGDTPAEISISIIAELFAVINNKPANHLRLDYSGIA
jgi:xanthine/CO dehydrogenase XdhC/CoxF family maturation factor